MKRLLVVLACGLTACLPQTTQEKEEPHYFSEKVRCNTEGQRYLSQLQKGGSSWFGEWGYHRKLGTCVGVFAIFHVDYSTYEVKDLLTNADLEVCLMQDCDANEMPAKWLPDNPREER